MAKRKQLNEVGPLRANTGESSAQMMARAGKEAKEKKEAPHGRGPYGNPKAAAPARSKGGQLSSAQLMAQKPKEESKKTKSGGKKGPKAWGKNLYGESDHDHDCDKEHPDKSHEEWEKDNVKEEGKKKKKKSSSNGKKGPKAWGKNLYGENVQKQGVSKFIANVSKKNYAVANKYLQSALEDKLKARIADTQDNLGF
tara:strand:+ start:459 stop:1049 length:591 start_codon:yes stop_codon:yes gene_type:complete